MNIIYLSSFTLNSYYSIAGSKRVLNQIEYLTKKNSVKVITISKYKSDFEWNINFKRFDSAFSYLTALPFYWLIICFFLIAYKSKGKNFVLVPTVINLNFAIPVLFCKLIGYKIIQDVVENFQVSTEEISRAQKINLKVINLFYKYTNWLIDGFIVISEGLLSKYSTYNKPIIKLYNSVKIPDFENTNTDRKFKFLYAGRFDKKDGVKDLIHAFNKISLNNHDLQLILIGENKTQYFLECIELIKSNKQISYLGYLSPKKLENEYSTANVLVITRENSEYANFGFPFKLSEYLSYKKPVISSSVSDIPLLFKDYENILLVKPSDVKSIVKKMQYCIENSNKLKQIGDNGFQKFIEYFSIPRNGKKLHEFLSSFN